jgi:hypothetical protein
VWQVEKGMEEVRRRLRAAGVRDDDVPVRGVVLFPGWWVERERHGNVAVMNAKEVFTNFTSSLSVVSQHVLRRVREAIL